MDHGCCMVEEARAFIQGIADIGSQADSFTKAYFTCAGWQPIARRRPGIG